MMPPTNVGSVEGKVIGRRGETRGLSGGVAAPIGNSALTISGLVDLLIEKKGDGLEDVALPPLALLGNGTSVVTDLVVPVGVDLRAVACRPVGVA